MIHAICDFCGQDCGTDAVFLTMTPFRNIGRTRSSEKPFGSTGARASFVMCDECREARNLPVPAIESTNEVQNARYRDAVNRRYGTPVSAKALYKALHDAGGCDASDDETRGYDRGIDTAISLLNEMTGVDAECLDEDEAESDGEAPWD